MWPPGNEDNLETIFGSFDARRSVDLYHRFSGWYRAIVEETNDPLNIRRVRVRIPELHDIDTEVDRLPWALPAPWHGGTNSGSFSYPAIKDVVYVCYEKNHPYVPIYCATPDSTRRRAYPLWSTYIKTPLAVNENGEPDIQPQDYEKKYLPKDGRPMSMGFVDHYGHYLLFNAHGFFPKTHNVKPAPVGTDAISKKDFKVAESQPVVNDPDLKYIAWGTKYGHTAIFGDQGYKWDKEFKGDFNQDQSFEVDRYKYLLKYYNEQKEKGRDQRRIDIRTRLGHKFEMRDVGWDKSRAGEYGDPVVIGDSQGRDERWVKLRSKGGHLIQLLDKGFDPESDNFYKRLNKTEMGSDPDSEDTIGDDSRMVRVITRHGNMLVLDDRGSDPRNGEAETPHGNGVLFRTRKGFQLQMCDKPDLDHVMLVTPKNQCFEMNDETQYIILSTPQSGDIHTKVKSDEIKSKPPWVNKKGLTNDPEANTVHIKLDKINDYCRMKTPDGSGFEARGGNATCGQWTETRDAENRAVWMSKTDQFLLIRNKTGELYLVLDDNDDAIMIRNEKGRVVIHAKKDIHFKSDQGDICFEAPRGEIGFKAKKMAADTDGSSFVWDAQGFGADKKIQAAELRGINTTALIPMHPNGLGNGFPDGRGANPCKFKEKRIHRKKPEDFDKERGCDPVKPHRGAVPDAVTSGNAGSGFKAGPIFGPGGDIDIPNFFPPDSSPTAPPPPVGPGPIPLPLEPDPLEEVNPGGGGVLWYGLSNKFRLEVEQSGLLVSSLTNNLNIPNALNANEIYLARSLKIAKGKKQALLSQERYGDVSLILRIRNVPDSNLLSVVDDEFVSYSGDISFEGNIEIFEIGDDQLTVAPIYPNV